MKTFFVILILSISASALSQQVPSRVGSTAQPPTTTPPAAMTNGTSGSTGTPISIPMKPSGLSETSTDDLKKLLNAQTNTIRRLAGMIKQLDTRIAKLESEAE